MTGSGKLEAARMHPLVRDLYKKILVVGRDYPTGLAHVRQKAKEMICKNRDAKGDDLKRAISYGRYMLREMIGIVQLKKYRTLKRRYEDPLDDTHR